MSKSEGSFKLRLSEDTTFNSFSNADGLTA
jgi:hypothetical protein